MLNNEPFEIRKIAYRCNFGNLGMVFDVEIYYPHKFHSVCYQMMGKDEADVMARVYRTHGKAQRADPSA